MANWKYTLRVKEDWQSAKRDEITLHELVRRIVPKLKALPPFESDADLQAIVDEMESLAADPDADVSWFDSIWDNLYDWADQCIGPAWDDKLCWIETF